MTFETVHGRQKLRREGWEGRGPRCSLIGLILECHAICVICFLVEGNVVGGGGGARGAVLGPSGPDHSAALGPYKLLNVQTLEGKGEKSS